jgi:hypothetical protein
MNPLKPAQRAACLALAALMSVAIAESIVTHAFNADPHQIVAKAGRTPAPTTEPVQQLAQAGHGR